MPELNGGSQRIDLGGGYALVAPGLRGRAERRISGAADLRAIEHSTPLFEDVLARSDMTTISTIDIVAAPLQVQPTTADLRDASGEAALLLEVPDLGPETGQVVLAIDEAGALSWHFPLDAGQIRPPSVRGSGDRKRFLISRRTPPTTPPEEGRDRALLGAFGRKLLKVIVYPISDLLITKPANYIAEYWEKQNRAYGLRDFSPENYRQATTTRRDRERLALTAEQLEGLARGPALLFVHGTFSNANGAFHDLPPEFVTDIHRRYGGRVFAFNHFTMAHGPQQNVQWFLDEIGRMQGTATLELDVVCHSRGGLVARTLAEGNAAFGIDNGRANVRRIAFVAVPNRGTLLANPDHVADMIDRYTTALNLFPPGSPADWLEGILIAVKIVGHGALNALAGLQSMHPDGSFLAALNKGGRRNAEYLAIAANYTPADAGLRSLVSRSVDALVDKVFEADENDLVVPERGVYEANGCDSFPISMDRCLRLPASAGVMHTTMFGNAEVQRRLGEWLQ